MVARKPVDLNALPLEQLLDELLPPRVLLPMLERFVEEDVQSGDVTSTALIPRRLRGSARIVAREAGVLAGLDAAALLALGGDRDLMMVARRLDGERFRAGETIAILEGSMRDLLAVERSVLNLLGRLSGVATTTAAFVHAIRGTRALLCDTRKTTPGLRLLEKYAVRCGGGTLHRLGLWDAILVKDNHLAVVGAGAGAGARAVAEGGARAAAGGPALTSLSARLRKARGRGRLRFIEVEVDSLDQLRAVLAMPRGTVDWVLLDNMTPAKLTEAVRLTRRARTAVKLEASGGVRLGTIRRIARSGVDRISTGAITHSAPSIDFGLDVVGGA